MRKILFASLFLLLSFSGYAQFKVTGIVKDSLTQTPVASASVVVSPAGKNTILSYGIANQDGKFSIAVQTTADSLLIKVSSLGYGAYKKVIPAKAQNLTVVMSQQAEDLETVFIRKPPIMRRGDTLIFDPDAFKSKKDRSILDVLSKMPGIDVKPSGEIYYQGKPINKFYVEGLDLMGGQYGMVADNLSPDEVKSVEVLEDHQPLRVLDSVQPSNRAAINITLKHKVTLAGNLRAGGGAAPGLWYAKLTPMFFIKNFQTLVSYQTNNAGINVGQDFSSFSVVGFRFGRLSNSQRSWLSVRGASTPPFSSRRWLDNESHAASINALYKNKKKVQFRVNTSYINKFQKERGGEKTVYTLPQGDLLIDNKTRHKSRDESFKTTLSIERNVDTKFLKESLTFSKKWDRATTNLLENNAAGRQYLTQPYTNISNTFEIIFPWGDQLVTFDSDIGYDESPQDLTVVPGVFGDILLPNDSLERVRQHLFYKTFYANHSLSFTKGLGPVNFTIRPGVDFSTQTMTSHLLLNGALDANQAYQNRMRWQKLNTYVNVGASYHSKNDKLRISLRMPFNFSNYQIKDRLNDTQQEKSPFTFTPSFWGDLKLFNYWKLTANAGLNKNYGPMNNIYSGYLLTYYRSLGRRKGVPLMETQGKYAGAGLEYRNPITSWFGTLRYSYSGSKQNQMVNLITQPDGSTVAEAINREQRSHINAVSASVSRLISGLGTTVKLNGSYSHSDGSFLYNSDLIKTSAESLSGSLRLSGDFGSWITVDYTGSLGVSKSSNAIRATNKIYTQNHSLGLYFYIGENSTLNFSGEWRKTKFKEDAREGFFGDFMYRYTILGKKKIDIELSVINVFNRDMYRTFSVGSYTNSTSYYFLRPRQFLLTVRIPL